MEVFAHHLDAVVHEQRGTDAALIIQPTHLVVQVQAHTYLQWQTTDGCSDTWRFTKQRLLGLDMLSPEVLRCA